MNIPPFKKIKFACLSLIVLLATLTQACKKPLPELGQLLYKKTHNPVFLQANQHDFDSVLKKVFDNESYQIRNAGFIKEYYNKNNYHLIE